MLSSRQSAGTTPIFRPREPQILTWLRAGYPELFDQEHLTERVWLYDICFRIRQLCAGNALDPDSLQNLAGLTMHPRMLLR